jgi:hypothetical protein
MLLYASRSLDERLVGDEPADAQFAQSVELREGADGDRTVESRGGDTAEAAAAVAGVRAVHLVDQQASAVVGRAVGDRSQRLAIRPRAGRVVSVRHGDECRLRAERGFDAVRIECVAVAPGAVEPVDCRAETRRGGVVWLVARRFDEHTLAVRERRGDGDEDGTRRAGHHEHRLWRHVVLVGESRLDRQIVCGREVRERVRNDRVVRAAGAQVAGRQVVCRGLGAASDPREILEFREHGQGPAAPDLSVPGSRRAGRTRR